MESAREEGRTVEDIVIEIADGLFYVRGQRGEEFK